MTLSIRTVCALAALSAPALAQASFTPFIGAGPAAAVSSDGLWVVGRGGAGAFVWNVAQGTVQNIGETDGVGVSTGGTKVLGTMTTTPKDTAGIWDSQTGMWTALPGLPIGTGCGSTLSSAYALSDDGMVATGLAWEGCKAKAFHWTPSGGTVKLPQLGFDSTRGNAVSGDGTHLGGWDQGLTGSRRAAVWKPDGLGGFTEVLPLEGTPGNPIGNGETWGLSTNGNWAVGHSPSGPFLYDTVNDVLTILPILPGPTASGDVFQGNAVRGDGELVIGVQGGAFGTQMRAWLWAKASGLVELDTVLTWYGLPAPAGWSLASGWDLTADGRTMTGDAWSPTAVILPDSGWILELPTWPWKHLEGGSPSGANGIPVLTGQGSVQPGSANSIHLENAAGSSLAVIAVAVVSSPIPLFDGTLHAFPPVYTNTQNTDPNGELTVNFTWPPLSSPGDKLTFQVGVIDGSSTFGVALSNGLEATTN